MMPDEELCASLEIGKEQPILRRIRISYDADHNIVEYTIGYYRGDRYAYYIQMKK